MVVELPSKDIGEALVGGELLVDVSDPPRPPPEIDRLGTGRLDEDDEIEPICVVTETENPLEGLEESGALEVLLLEDIGPDKAPAGAVETLLVRERGGAETVEYEEDEREPPLSGPVENVGEGIPPVEDIVMLGFGPKVVGLTV